MRAVMHVVLANLLALIKMRLFDWKAVRRYYL